MTEKAAGEANKQMQKCNTIYNYPKLPRAIPDPEQSTEEQDEVQAKQLK